MNSPARAPKLILASTSHYRRALLERFEVPFEAMSPGIEETPLANEEPLDLAHRLDVVHQLREVLELRPVLYEVETGASDLDSRRSQPL